MTKQRRRATRHWRRKHRIAKWWRPLFTPVYRHDVWNLDAFVAEHGEGRA